MGSQYPAGAFAPATSRAAASPLAQRIMASTTKGNTKPAVLLLEDGAVFYGRGCGADGTATGEVCFNTSLEGYFEVMTDPSYAGQIVTMTYPQIGNYGIDLADVQTALPGRDLSAPALRGMIVRDMCRTPSNWRSSQSVPEYLEIGASSPSRAWTRARSCSIFATTARRWGSSRRRPSISASSPTVSLPLRNLSARTWSRR